MVKEVAALKIWRMTHWLVFANLLYLVALLPGFDFKWPPQVQTGLLAAGNCALAAWIGFWIDHAAFLKIDTWRDKHDTVIAARVVAKGLILLGCIIGANLKLG